MEDILVVKHIKELCRQHGWTIYKLAQKANIPYSSLNTMLKQNHIPTINSLIKICFAFEITLAEFFAGIEGYSISTPENCELMGLWNILDSRSRELVLTYMYGLAERKRKINKNDI